MPRAVSAADRQLLAVLTGAGLEVNHAQLERWRARGLLTPAERQWLGRGKGSTSVLPPQALAEAVVLAVFSRQGKRYPTPEEFDILMGRT